MRLAIRIVVGVVLTAGLAYASYWVWLEVQTQIRGTLISSFGIFAGVIAAFMLLSLAQAIIGFVERQLAKSKTSTEVGDTSN